MHWRHVTATGVRWSLRHRDASHSLLLVDLGSGRAARITDDRGVESLDAAGMSQEVDHLRSTLLPTPLD